MGHAALGARPRQRAADAAPGARHAPDHQPLRAAAADREPGGLLVESPTARASTTPSATGLRVLRPGEERGDPARLHAGAGARAARMHRGGAHAGLDALGDDARALRRDRGELARRDRHERRTSPRSPRAPASSAGRWPRWPPTRTSHRWQRRLVLLRRLARDYGFTDLDGTRPDCWRYIVEVQDAGLPGGPHRLPLNRARSISFGGCHRAWTTSGTGAPTPGIAGPTAHRRTDPRGARRRSHGAQRRCGGGLVRAVGSLGAGG